MSFFKPKPEELESVARSLHLRADELDRQGHHFKAQVERDKAGKLEAKAASKRTAATA